MVVILLAYVFTFLVISVLPGDPITNSLRDPQNGFTEDEIKEIIAHYGLDQPVLRPAVEVAVPVHDRRPRVSLRSNLPVSPLIGEVLPSTLVLASAALVGRAGAGVRDRLGTQYLPATRSARACCGRFPSLFLSVPNFVIGLVLIHIFAFQLGLFRVIDAGQLRRRPSSPRSPSASRSRHRSPRC